MCPSRGSMRPSRGSARLLEMPWRADARAVRRDRDRVLEVSGEGAVAGVDRPVVVAHADRVAARGDHGLEGEHHALLEDGPGAGRAEVRYLRILVHITPHAVADERAHHGEALRLDSLLNRVRDVAEA